MTLLNKGVGFRFVTGAPISSATCCGAVRASNATAARSEASRAAVAAPMPVT